MRAFVSFLSVLVVGGCTVEGDYRLDLVFPSDEARQATDRVEIWALDPGGGTCEELVDGSIAPGDMTEHANLVIRMSATEDAGKLLGVPAGTVLFFAEGRTAGEAVILRGCERKQVKGAETFSVTIILQLICGPVPETEIVGNSVDDDCDGATDEEECTQNTDCEDGSVCTADFCINELCQRTNMDGIDCNDANPCTTGDTCSGGACSGTDRDCSDFDGQCLAGACNPATVECEPVPRQDGTGCDDGLYCTVNDACLAGVCSGNMRNCSDIDPCTRDRCNEALGDCEHTLEPKPDGEGPQGNATCNDLVDNDCDGLTDGADPNCQACTVASDCEDNNPCTTDDCVGGVCSNLAVEDGSDCDDGFFCTVEDHCEGGACVSSSRDCSAFADPCHLGGCIEAQDRCSAIPKADYTPCNDGRYCTVGDQCISEVCTPIGDRICDDSDFCTIDSCDEELDRCVFVLDPRPGEEGPPGDNTCSNGQDDDCDGLTDLQDGNCYDCLNNSDCDDGNDCTTDTCANDLCSNQPAAPGTSCDDGDPCTMDDECSGDYCTGAPLDADGDGYVSAACGGADCDDSTQNARPGLFEGPDDHASCSDGIDNDCDGKADEYDTHCWARVCSSTGWCWENPLPQGNGLSGIWGFSPGNVWMVGWYGTILHWDGVAISKFDWAGTDKILYDVWGTAPGDIWAVGSEGYLARYNGTSWSSRSSGTTYWLYAIWGFAANDIWVGEAAGRVNHYNGSGWTESGTGTGSRLLGIWGPDPDHLWAVGWDGAIRYRSGGSWGGQTSNTTEYLNGVWGASIDDVWAVGNNGVILRRQGTAWSQVDGGVTAELYDVWGTAADNVWAVGEDETILRFDGDRWSPGGPPATRSAFSVSTGDLRALWGTAANDVWAVGHGGTVLRYDGSRWTDLTKGHRGALNGVWAQSMSDAWAVGDGCAVLRRDATTRTWVPHPVTGCTEDLTDISGTAASNIWAVGGAGKILRFNGSAWSAVASNTGAVLNDVWALSLQEAWAVGDGGVIVRYANGQWGEVNSGVVTDLNGVWAFSTDMAVAVGDGGVIRHWDGIGWSERASGVTENLYAVWGFAQDDIWAVGRAPTDGNGVLLYYDGVSWSSRSSGVPDTLTSIWGDPNGQAWALGRGGALIRLVGTTWFPMETSVGTRMADISGSSDGNIWIVGGSGNVLRYPP